MKDNKITHRVTERILDVLEIISSNSDGYTLTEICMKIDAPKSSMSPILHTLVQRQFLFIDNHLHYKIDLMAFKIGNRYLENFNFMDEVQNALQNIVNICAETCHFAILIDGDVFYLKKIDSPEHIRMVSTIGKRIPAYGTALGKALLIDYSKRELQKLYPNGLKSLTEHTITDFTVLEDQLNMAQTEGFTYEIEESNQYIRCISVPIRKNHVIVAAISVAIPTFRYDEEKASLVKTLLVNSKNKLEKILQPLDVDFRDLV